MQRTARASTTSSRPAAAGTVRRATGRRPPKEATPSSMRRPSRRSATRRRPTSSQPTPTRAAKQAARQVARPGHRRAARRARPTAGNLHGPLSCCDSRPIAAGHLFMGQAFDLSAPNLGPDDDDPNSAYNAGFDQPEHDATITKAFHLDTFEVTVGRFRAFASSLDPAFLVAGAGANHRCQAPAGKRRGPRSWRRTPPVSRACSPRSVRPGGHDTLSQLDGHPRGGCSGHAPDELRHLVRGDGLLHLGRRTAAHRGGVGDGRRRRRRRPLPALRQPRPGRRVRRLHRLPAGQRLQLRQLPAQPRRIVPRRNRFSEVSSILVGNVWEMVLDQFVAYPTNQTQAACAGSACVKLPAVRRVQRRGQGRVVRPRLGRGARRAPRLHGGGRPRGPHRVPLRAGLDGRYPASSAPSFANRLASASATMRTRAMLRLSTVVTQEHFGYGQDLGRHPLERRLRHEAGEDRQPHARLGRVDHGSHRRPRKTMAAPSPWASSHRAPGVPDVLSAKPITS